MTTITIEPAINKEAYVVTTCVYDDEIGYIDTVAVCDPHELGEYLMQFLPYDVKPKNNKTVENPKSNVQPFPCR